MTNTLLELLKKAVQQNASDVHLTTGAEPTFRINGILVPSGDPILMPEDTDRFLKEIIGEKQYRVFRETGEVDFTYTIEGLAQFRVNAYKQRGDTGLAIRVIPPEIPRLDQLGVAPVVQSFAERDQGLVIITGPTGSGKSTTLAAMVDWVNRNRHKHIITLEDPIEYVHQHRQSLIEQREIGKDTRSFASALRAALRQDPDVILVGEMRDLETIATTITAAETGHLVLATLHTADAVNAVDRMIDVFPANQQQQIRVQLASVLIGVVAQRLVPASDLNNRVLAMEVLVNTPAAANLIRSGKVHQMKSLIQTGKNLGMQTMEAALEELAAQGKIDQEMVRKAKP
ncbi:MAG: type IV pilus twitching motility protein PilT [Bacillaceae bacterium]|nr:type IV pilus twitching motility protein PilT [Bacillaceae bacterium]